MVANTFKAKVVLLGGSHSAGLLYGTTGTQTKVESPAGHWRAEGGSAAGAGGG